MKTGKVIGRPFTKGHKFSKGSKPGGNPGSGRPPNWFKQACDDALHKYKLFDLLANIAKGDKEDFLIVEGGKTRKIPARVRDRITAIQELIDRGHGRATQHIDVSSDAALMELLSLVTIAVKQNVPRACPHCKKELGFLQTLAEKFRDLEQRVKDKMADTAERL